MSSFDQWQEPCSVTLLPSLEGKLLVELVQGQTHLNPGRRSMRILFSRVSILCSYSVYVFYIFFLTPVNCSGTLKTPAILPRVQGGRLHLNRHTPLTQWIWRGPTMTSRCSVWIGKNEHTCHCAYVHTWQECLASHHSLLSHCGLLLA